MIATAMVSTVPHDRLRGSHDIAAVLRGRHHRAGRLVVLYGRPRGDEGPPRVAVVASRKVGTAVARNRAKRLLREAARAVPFAAGWDLVLVARGACAACAQRDVTEELAELAAELGVGRPPRRAA